MKIPPQAKRVFKGVIFDVYQWEQEMFDGSKQTFEMAKRPDTVEVIAMQGDKVLIAEQEQPGRPKFLSLFGGRCEEGEESLLAAQRELLEETGLASNDWELWRTYQPGGKIDWTLYYYIARNCTNIADQKLDSGERIHIRALSFTEFIETVASKEFGDYEMVADVLRMKLDPIKLEEFRRQLFPKKP